MKELRRIIHIQEDIRRVDKQLCALVPSHPHFPYLRLIKQELVKEYWSRKYLK
jgi:hypothetical protein